MPPPTAHQETWLIDFARVLTEARPDLGQKFVNLIASRAWVRHKNMTAEEAATLWISVTKQAFRPP
jgi:hypothetical protein